MPKWVSVAAGIAVLGIFILAIGVVADIRTGRPVSFSSEDISIITWTAIAAIVAFIGYLKNR